MVNPEMKEIKNNMVGADEFCPRECGLSSNGDKEIVVSDWGLEGSV